MNAIVIEYPLYSTGTLYQSPRICTNAVAHANLSKCTTVYITLAASHMYYTYVSHIMYYNEYITQIVLRNLLMELRCIHCKSLVQLGTDAHTKHVQPIMDLTWKGA